MSQVGLENIRQSFFKSEKLASEKNLNFWQKFKVEKLIFQNAKAKQKKSFNCEEFVSWEKDSRKEI